MTDYVDPHPRFMAQAHDLVYERFSPKWSYAADPIKREFSWTSDSLIRETARRLELEDELATIRGHVKLTEPNIPPPPNLRQIHDEVSAATFHYGSELTTKIYRTNVDLYNARVGKANAYQERDFLVCALSKVFPSSLERHPDEDTTWENEWRWIVFINFPTGQGTWHIHDSELSMFDHLARHTGAKWDGHSTRDKYVRLSALGLVQGFKMPCG